MSEQIIKLSDTAAARIKEIMSNADNKTIGVRIGVKSGGCAGMSYSMEYAKDKKANDTVTVKVLSSDIKGLLVRPEGCKLDFVIKKSQIAISAVDARPSRFVGSERIDAAIAELNMEKRKVTLSIKLLEELKNKEAVSRFSSPLSGKNLPFSSLSDKLEKKKKK